MSIWPAIFRQVVPTSPSIPVSLGMLAGPGSALGQSRYLLSCRNKRFPTPANFESNLSVTERCGRQKTELPNSREFVCYKCTNIAIGSNGKMVGLKHLRFPDIVQKADLQMGRMQDSRRIRIIIGVVWEVIGSRGVNYPLKLLKREVATKTWGKKRIKRGA